MVVEALVSLTKMFVPFRARRNARGEAIVRIALFIRILVCVPVVLLSIVTCAAFKSDREPESGWIIAAVTVLTGAGVAAVWWAELRWSAGGLYIRPAFRRGTWYEWDDRCSLSGTEQSWVLEMDDKVRFRGNKWTSGGGEFLELMATRLGGCLPEY